MEPLSRTSIDPSLLWDDKPETETTARKLAAPIDVGWNEAKFADVIAELRWKTGVNLYVDTAALQAAGIESGTPVSITLVRTPAHVVLQLVLDQCKASLLEPTGFVLIDGMVRITTARQLQKIVDTRVYDIRDLVMTGSYANFLSAPQFDLNSALSCSSSGSRGVPHVATTLFKDDDDPKTMEERQAEAREMYIEQIVTMIQDTVGSQTEWAAYGGEVSSLRELNGNLIVKTTPGNHREIDRLLVALRGGRMMVEMLSGDPKGIDAGSKDPIIQSAP